jgi:arylsulfatase A-like enzyme
MMVLTRRQLLGSAALAPAAAKRRPNVLVFLSDQESALLPGPVDLPNRRRIERGGVRFTHAFANTPQCSAARASLLTGLEPHRTGVLTNVDANSLGKPLSPSLATVGSVFREAGYSTGYFGKWHLGGGDRAAFGFQTAGVERDDARIAAQAAEWIAGQRGPWLAWVSVLNPHDIYGLRDVPLRPGVRPPASGLENLNGKPFEQQEYVDKDQGKITRHYTPADWLRYRSYYCRLVEMVDTNLGTVLDAVPDLDSAAVVYTSDHGDALGEHGLPFKGPFMYEENIRVPLLVRAPWALGGSERGGLVTLAELAPALASLAGLEWPGRPDGRGLFGGEPRDAVFLEYYAKQKWINPIRTIRTRRWKLNWYDRGNRELYDLQRDPRETRNLAGQAEVREVQAGLERRIAAWRPPMVS